jgi:kinesin family member C1
VDVFDEVREVVRSALDGFRVCIFAYGQTCAGKTYTMEGGGTHDTMGLVPRSVNMVFETLQKYQKEDWQKVQVSLSCFEIHIETVRDLLDPKNEQVQFMTNQGKFKTTEIEVRDASDVDFVLKKARENRKVA